MDLQEVISKAAKAADAAPSELRESAFKTVLEHLLRGADAPGAPRPAPAARESMESGKPTPIDSSRKVPEAHLVKDEGDRRQQVMWAMLTLHERGSEVTTEEIIRVIRSELGIAPQSVANTGRTLRKLTPKYVMRRERAGGVGYIYEPTPRSYDIFEGLG